MDDSRERIGQRLVQELAGLREQKGSLSYEDIGSVFMALAAMFKHGNAPDQFVQHEISCLAHYISDAKQEILASAGNSKSESAITDASLHLDEVIRATEDATHNIMDATDTILHAAKSIGGPKEKQLTDAANRIYGSCNFQDIIGQRINGVIKLLADIEERISALNGMYGESAANDKIMPMTAANDKCLLNGPQLSAKAPSQAEIDRLFASLGGKK